MLPDVGVATEVAVGAVHTVHLVPTIELHYTCTGITYETPSTSMVVVMAQSCLR
jgi:hypothetical protein